MRIALQLNLTDHERSTLPKWRRRFVGQRLDGLYDAPRSGTPPKYDETTDKRILAALDEIPRRIFPTGTGRF